jgi:hypothetical protein
MTTKTKLSLITAALIGASGLSFGGMKSSTEVSIFNSGYYASAQGNLTDVRNSADNIQYIGCKTITYQATGNPQVSCFARSATGQSVGCYATQPSQAMIDQIRSIGRHSTIYFNYNASSGTCQAIDVSTWSHAGGMQ